MLLKEIHTNSLNLFYFYVTVFHVQTTPENAKLAILELLEL